MTILSEIRIPHASHLPPRVQLIDQISYSIGSGRLQPGGRLPSEFEFHNDLKIDCTTIRHTFHDMKLADLVECMGTFVSHRTPNIMSSGLGWILFLRSEFSSKFECCLLRGIESVAISQGYQAGLFSQILSCRKVGAVVWPISILPIAERLRSCRDALTPREIAPAESWIVGKCLNEHRLTLA